MEVQIKKLAKTVDLNFCLMPNELFDALKLSSEILYKIQIGQSYAYSNIIPREGFDKCMYFPKSVYKKLPLFDGITLNVWSNEDGIYLGPVVGVFVNPLVTAAIRIGMPSFFIQKHAEAGSETNCLSYYYSMEGINWFTGMIKGYTFIRSLNKWKYAWFPIPDVLYDRGEKFYPYVRFMEKQFRAKKVHFINNRSSLGKWKVHECLSQYPEVSAHLPEAAVYRSFSDVLSMLDKYKFIFVKASVGSKGKRVLSIEQIEENYKLTFNKHGLKEITLKEIADVKMFVEKFTKGRQFVVQQGIRLLKYDGRNMDFRILMMKDGQGNWEAVQHHCRIAQKNFTITNTSLGADWVDFEKVYPSLDSHFCEKRIPDKEELINAAKKILSYYEKEFGAFGEIGMDMAIDIYGDIWFIEANIRPDKLSMPSLYDPKEIPVQAINIFEYAKFLAGKPKVKPAQNELADAASH